MSPDRNSPDRKVPTPKWPRSKWPRPKWLRPNRPDRKVAYPWKCSLPELREFRRTKNSSVQGY